MQQQSQSEKRLQGMINKTFKYGVRIVVITGYFIDEDRERVFIHTDHQDNHFDRLLIDLNSLLKEFQPVEETQLDKTKGSGLVMAQGRLGNTVRDILLDNIEKVKANKEYIPQAQAINEQIGQLLNLAKVEVEYLKVIKT